jgi:hypothetical protein
MPCPPVHMGQPLRLKCIRINDFIYLQDLSRLWSFRIIGDLLNICEYKVLFQTYSEHMRTDRILCSLQFACPKSW